MCIRDRPFENNQDIFDAFDFDQPYIADPDDPDSARITGMFIYLFNSYCQKFIGRIQPRRAQYIFYLVADEPNNHIHPDLFIFRQPSC